MTRHLPIEQHAQSRRRPPSTSTLTAELATVLVGVPETAWRPAVNADGSDERDGTEVTEITDLVDLSALGDGLRMIARREDPHPGARLTFTDTRAFVDLLTRWDDWCDEVEQTLTAGEARGADRFGGVEYLPPVVAPTLYCTGRTTSITSRR